MLDESTRSDSGSRFWVGDAFASQRVSRASSSVDVAAGIDVDHCHNDRAIVDAVDDSPASPRPKPKPVVLLHRPLESLAAARPRVFGEGTDHAFGLHTHWRVEPFEPRFNAARSMATW